MLEKPEGTATASMRVAAASGIFTGVNRASLALGGGTGAGADRGSASAVLTLSLDSWESPLVFGVSSVTEGTGSATVYEAALRQGQSAMTLVLVDHGSGAESDRPADIWVAEVTSTHPDGFLRLEGTPRRAD